MTKSHYKHDAVQSSNKTMQIGQRNSSFEKKNLSEQQNLS